MVQEVVKYRLFTRDDAYNRAREMVDRGYYHGDVDELAENIYKTNKDRVNEYNEKQKEIIKNLFKEDNEDEV